MSRSVGVTSLHTWRPSTHRLLAGATSPQLRRTGRQTRKVEQHQRLRCLLVVATALGRRRTALRVWRSCAHSDALGEHSRTRCRGTRLSRWHGQPTECSPAARGGSNAAACPCGPQPRRARHVSATVRSTAVGTTAHSRRGALVKKCRAAHATPLVGYCGSSRPCHAGLVQRPSAQARAAAGSGVFEAGTAARCKGVTGWRHTLHASPTSPHALRPRLNHVCARPAVKVTRRHTRASRRGCGWSCADSTRVRVVGDRYTRARGD